MGVGGTTQLRGRWGAPASWHLNGMIALAGGRRHRRGATASKDPEYRLHSRDDQATLSVVAMDRPDFSTRVVDRIAAQGSALCRLCQLGVCAAHALPR